MPLIPIEQFHKLNTTFGALYNDRSDFWPHWRECADFVLPRRYNWLASPVERRRRMSKNPNILDGTGTVAARVLAAGLMNGITSPSRPWFKLRTAGAEFDFDPQVQAWLDEVQRRMMRVMAESNFYNALATMYLDLVVFGTACCIIYEDFESVIRCYNPALGEFYLAQDFRLQVNTVGREFEYKVAQIVARWGEENVPAVVRNAYKKGGAHLQNPHTIMHLIEPNIGPSTVPSSFAYRETYWVKGAPQGEILAQSPFNEFPAVCPRWEVTGNDSYGVSPTMEALGDIIQLQHETKKKGQGLDKMLDPPMIADIQLQNKSTPFLPRSITYVAGVNNVGAKPAYQINMPLGELSADIQDVRERIREIYHNDLFLMISQLDTVRSATEIDARREEKLVQLGSVLERFENEALDPAIERVFAIMSRAGLLPEAPQILEDADIEIQYVSILSVAQSAVGVAPTERLLQLLGNIAAVKPEVMDFPNWDELLSDYSRDIGVKAKNFRPGSIDAATQARQQAEAGAQQAAMGTELVQGAQTLSQTDVGGGANALQRLLGG